MMHDYNNNPYFANLQEKMKQVSEQMHTDANSPEIKELQRKMKAKSDEMRAYTNSPEFKKKTAEWQKSMKWDWNSDASNTVEAPAPPPAPEVKAPEPPAKPY